MKKVNLLLTAAALAICSPVLAQDFDNRERMVFGLKVGTNYSNMYDSRSDDFRADSKIGFAAGAFLGIPLNKYIGLQPEFFLIQKGFKGEGSFLGSNYSFTRTTTYIDVPLQIAIKPSEFITLVAGPQFSYLLRQTDDFKTPFVNTTQEEDFKNENLRKNIFGFLVGADINIKHLVLGARVGWDVSSNQGDGTSSTPRYKNTWIMTTIGYSF